MRTTLASKTLFRTPVKTLFTFLLIAVLIFSLLIQLTEYCKTAAEFHATVDSYEGTGYVEYRVPLIHSRQLQAPIYIGTDPRIDAPELSSSSFFYYPPLSAETAAEITALPYVTAYTRYMTAGVSDSYKRMRDDPVRYDYNNRIIVEGTLDHYDPSPYVRPNSRYYLRDVKILAGDAVYEDITYIDGTMYFSDTVYQSDTLKTYPEPLVVGDRYVAVCRFERGKTNRGSGTIAINETRESLQLYDKVSEHACPALWNITDAPENYLDLPDYAPLKKLIELTDTDLYTFDVVYADDMSAIRRLHEDTLHLAEGRWLTPEDTVQNAKVCVLDRVLARQYQLEVGDTLTLKLGHSLFEQFYTLGAVAATEERFSDSWTEDTFEIVGLYTGGTMAQNAREPNWAYSVNTVFVPLSALPLTERELAGHAFAPGEFTIRVENAWDIGPFLEESAPQIEAMDLKLTFDDGGWMQVLEDYHSAQRLPMIRILLLAFVTVTGLALSVYLFVSRKKKDYAIMRALGAPKKYAGRALLIPITVLTAAAVLAAVSVGLAYSRRHIGAVFLLPVAISIPGALACTLLFAGLSLHRLSRKPPLLLLQDAGTRSKKNRRAAARAAADAQGTLYVPRDIRISTEPLPVTRRPASPGFILGYLRRHIRRQGLKSALAVLLAALMVGAVVQFASLRNTYHELRTSTVVSVRFVNSLSLERLWPLEDDGLAKDVYYERGPTISCLSGIETISAQLAITPDIGRFVNQDYTITLGEGYTEADIGKLDHVLVGVNLMESIGIQPGDTLRFGTDSDFTRIFRSYRQQYLYEKYESRGLTPDYPPTAAEVYAEYRSEMDRHLDMVSAEAEVIGWVRTQTGTFQSSVFTAGLDDPSSLVGTHQTMPLIEFTLADNSRLEEIRQRGVALTNGREGAFVLDSEPLERVIRTSELLDGLYLPVLLLALLIGAALCALLVMQTSKEAAIMRAQGTTRRTTRTLLAAEQILLGAVGLLLGLGVMLALKGAAFVPVAGQAGLFAGGYVLILIAGSYVSAGIATRKNILELLQTRE